MKQLTINASVRNESGSASSGRIRAAGKVPAVVYGKSKEPANLTVDARELRMLLREIGNNTPIVQLKKGDKEAVTSIIQEVQRHPMKDTYTHVDFREVAADEFVDVVVPVHPAGEAWGVKNENGTLETVAKIVHIRALPANIPAAVEADVRALKVGESFHVKQLPELEGVRYLDNPDQPIFAVIK